MALAAALGPAAAPAAQRRPDTASAIFPAAPPGRGRGHAPRAAHTSGGGAGRCSGVRNAVCK